MSDCVYIYGKRLMGFFGEISTQRITHVDIPVSLRINFHPPLLAYKRQWQYLQQQQQQQQQQLLQSQEQQEQQEQQQQQSAAM
ncbi:probable ubiquitin thioesterase DG1039 [Mastomys coucha]|uniref:probable ubiquitin thioesterase DG1039 n=1 Tax=Mastomys coucha TaxID=35658 RepID=UPI0012627E6A|nr:probable ubiquitin thioesterase DG1039 [Mastomys coucha]